MRRLLQCAIVFCLCTAVTTTWAIDVDWFAGIQLSDGDRTYLNISAAHFDADQKESRTVAGRLRNPEADFPVLLFLAAESGRSLSFIAELRLGGASWWEIRARLGIPPDRIFVSLPRDPGPPYGKAHGYYKKGGKKSKASQPVIDDGEFADWVGIRVLSQAYGIEPMAVIEARRSGVSLGAFAEKQKGRAGSHKQDKDQQDGPSSQKNKGKGKGGQP